MTRKRRVRQLATRDLVDEAAALLIDLRLHDCYDRPGASQTTLCAHETRWLRIAREIARRDYRFREHGRECACSDCLRLLEEWTDLQRRGDHTLAPW